MENTGSSSATTTQLDPVLDPLYIAPNDNPGMQISSVQFNGTKFTNWSRQIKRGLAAKHKLGFITGTVQKPASEDTVEGQKWITVDYLVSSWILNSMKQEFIEAFSNAPTAAKLWGDITERYGQNNGPLVYQLEQEVNQISQGSLSIAEYFSKLKKVWEELDSINPPPIRQCTGCTCGLNEKIQQREERAKIIQFLMKLNENYEYIISQIMSMDPLPPINKTYNLVRQVEKQKQITALPMDPPTAFYSSSSNTSNVRKEFKKPKDPSQRKFCDYCKSEGHTFENCFERIGYPDWWKGPKKNNQQQAGKRFYKHANCVQDLTIENPLEHETNHIGLDQ